MLKKINLNKVFWGLILSLFLIRGVDAVGSQLLSSKDNEIEDVNKETLGILLTLKSLRLDASILDNPVFESLIDFNIELKERPKGRLNPFKNFTAEDLLYESEEEEEKEEVSVNDDEKQEEISVDDNKKQEENDVPPLEE